jgi:exopolysaccharide biosynthesis polyprenyl glycosylphosphotransferase
LVSGLVSVCYFYINPVTYISPKLLLVFLFFLYGLLLWLWRYLYEKRWIQNQKYRIGVGFIGITKEVEQIVRELGQHPLLGCDARFFFDLNPSERGKAGDAAAVANAGAREESPSAHGEGEIRRISDVSLIRPLIQETNVDLLVMAVGQSELPSQLIRTLYGLLDIKVRFMRLPDFYEMIFRRVPINAINESWFLEHVDLKAATTYETIKGILDRVLAALVLLISLPFFPLIALGIKLESKGPVFFKQERVGRNGRLFTMIKFRTMREEGNDFSPTEEGDGRITRFGAFLRSARIDEIPQVLNILRGEMSFIGPRPERPEIARKLAEAIPYYQQRHLLRPGVTGWDQVCGEYHSPSIADTKKKLQYDLYYLKNISFSLDISIACRTIMTMLRRKGR